MSSGPVTYIISFQGKVKEKKNKKKRSIDMRVFIKATQAKLSENWKTRWKLEGTENKGIVRCWI